MHDCKNKETLVWHNQLDFGSDDLAGKGLAHFAAEVERQVKKPEDLDFAYPEFPDFKRHVETLLQKAYEIMGCPFNGVGIDIGSGCGVGSALLSKLPTVEKIYALDISEDFVEKIMPLTFDRVQADCGKIIKVVGNFNDIKLQDNSLDFAIEIGAFHHSTDLSKTIQESHRILKPNGWLVLLERARPDNYRTDEIEFLLNIEFGDELKKRYGIPLSQKVTRKNWGENEYRLSYWASILKDNGFKVSLHQTLELKRNEIISMICNFISKFIDYDLMKKILYKIQFHHWFHKHNNRVLLVCQKY